jgi:AraC-like DNA-binding protein
LERQISLEIVSKMDPLSDVIALLRPHAIFSKPITGRGRWGVFYPPHEAPGFSVVLKGRCWMAVGDSPPILLERGDFQLGPTIPAFRLYSDPGADCIPGPLSSSGVRHGEQDGEPDFESLGGTFKIERVNAALLLQLLPEMILIRAIEGDTSRLTRIVGLIMEECAADRPGREMMLERLLEAMLIESLRSRRLDHDTMPSGLLAGLRDPAIAGALRAMHSEVRHGWTVGELARHAGMSRSAFAARFAETIGCAPMEYLSRWRMSLAQDALKRNGTSLDRVAEDIGYQSASAFSTAFRRRTGYAPGAFARAHSGSDTRLDLTGVRA